MKTFTWFFLPAVLMVNVTLAQRVDTVINMGNYRSYYSYTLKDPLYVTYTLKNGGGDCDRSGFTFHACGISTASPADYAYSGYQEGHLANAEDFAYDCTLDKNTFCFFNCVPQTGKLNMGIWKTWEGHVRDSSQNRPLFIVAGSIFGAKIIKPGHNVAVPDFCYKIVFDAQTGSQLLCLIFPNDDSDTVSSITLEELKRKCGYNLTWQN